MDLFVAGLGIVLLLISRTWTGRGRRLIYVAMGLTLLPLGMLVGRAILHLAIEPSIAASLFLLLLIVTFVCVLRLCYHVGQRESLAPPARETLARSAQAKKVSDTALGPQSDEEVERVIEKIAKDRADLAMMQLKSNLRRVSPDLNDPKD